MPLTSLRRAKRVASHSPSSRPGRDAGDIKILSAIAMKPVYEVLVPLFEHATGYRLALRLMASPAVRTEILSGNSFDVAVSNPPIIERLINEGEVVADTRTDIARSPVSVVMRAGSPKLDTSSSEAFKRVLLNAKSIAHSDGGVGAHFLGVLDHLGIAEEMKDRLKIVPAFSGAGAVARGEAELAVIAATAIPGTDGVEVAGLLPVELRPYIEFAGGVGTTAKAPDSAKAFLAFLGAPENTRTFRQNGMDRLG
jgi:molybdate transport system substrate-binding protein